MEKAWRLGVVLAVEFLTGLLTKPCRRKRCRKSGGSVVVPIFRGNVQNCSNYRGIKLLSHIIKLWERVIEAKVTSSKPQYGFMPTKSKTDTIFLH